MSKTMTAAVLDEFGANLSVRSVPRPTAGPRDVLVRVAASGVNPLDVKISAGAAAHAKVSTPAVLGIDMAGTVEEVGPDVSRFHVGDQVYGMVGGVGGVPGTLAEYVVADAELLALKPESLSMAQSAALPLSAITAWEGLVDRAGVHEGQRVLVHGGAGGVGHIAIQIAIAHGATVFATGSPSSLEVIRSLGATPIDRTATSVEDYVDEHTDGEGFDIIFDTVGGTTLDASFTAVRRYTGHVVSILGWGSHSLAPLSFRGATYSGVFTLLPLITGDGRAHHGEILAAIAALADAGALIPLLHEQVYELSEITIAHTVVGAGTDVGKVVVRM